MSEPVKHFWPDELDKDGNFFCKTVPLDLIDAIHNIIDVACEMAPEKTVESRRVMARTIFEQLLEQYEWAIKYDCE
jgi:hypothetical protein